MPAIAKSVLLKLPLYFIGPVIALSLEWGFQSLAVSLACAISASLLHVYYRNIYVSWPVFFLRLAAYTGVQLMISAIFRQQGSAYFMHPADHIPAVESHVAIPMEGKIGSEFLSEQPVVTLSIVLPCANEGRYSWMTANSIAEVTPDEVLHEIIIVDDGSSPPLISQFPRDIMEKAKVRFVRHETHTGLINAKAAGANVATGDIVVFLDCHVRPAAEWHVSIIEKIRSNYRRVVVPSITGLNPDTWEEERTGSGGGLAKCYLTWDADFKWFDSDDDTVGVMSGGLLAMSRQWWIETGGYDTAMKGWGGENIDQSLRIWLCGGEIVQATKSFVGHMWRTHDKPQTIARYSVPPGSVNVNRYRGASVWMGEWKQKLESFSSFTQFKNKQPDVGNIISVKDRLECKDFTYFIDKFYKVYHWGGLLPQKVFKLRDTHSGLCIERKGAEDVILSQCSDDNSGQWWHRSNRDGDQCCSGYRNWNSDQCLSGGWIGSKLRTFVCNVGGLNKDQYISLSKETHQLELSQRPGACLGGKPAKKQRAALSPCNDGLTQTFRKLAIDQSPLDSPEQTKSESFRLEDSKRPGLCLAATGENDQIGRLEIHDCDSKNSLQIFSLISLPSSGNKRLQSRGLVSLDSSQLSCVDAGLGNQEAGLYPCYDQENANQDVTMVIESDDKNLVRFKFKKNLCLSIPNPPNDPKPESLTLHGCVVEGNVIKRGQFFERMYLSKDDLTLFYLKNRDGKCLSTNAQKAFIVTSEACHTDIFKQDPSDPHKRLLHVPSNLCFDGNDGTTPTLYSCYRDDNPNQQIDISNGYIKVQLTDTCVDFEPVTPSGANVVACPLAQSTFHWEEYKPFVPIETQLYLKHKSKTSPPA